MLQREFTIAAGVVAGYTNSGFCGLGGFGGLSGLSGLAMERREERATDKVRYEPVGAYGAQLRHERPQGDAAMDVGEFFRSRVIPLSFLSPLHSLSRQEH